MEEYNPNLCAERHQEIREFKVEIFKRLKTVENRWLVLMLGIVANLGGVIAILITK